MTKEEKNQQPEHDQEVIIGTPYDYLLDVTGVNGYSYVVPQTEGGRSRGMLIRRILLHGKNGDGFDMHLTLPDLAFVGRAISEYLSDDVETLGSLGGFELILGEKTRDRIVSDLRGISEKMKSAADDLERQSISSPHSASSVE